MQDVLKLESDALLRASNSLTEFHSETLSGLFSQLQISGGNLVFTGVGKSGFVGLKLAATFSSLGLPSFFLHPTEALHGDLGRVQAQDVMVLISKSGNTEEIKKLLPFFDIPKERRIGLLGDINSTLAKEVGLVLDCSVEKEACLNNLAPTTSTTVAMAMGDAMAVLFEKVSGLSKEKYAEFHPGGMLGKSLKMKVKDLMWYKDECPVLDLSATLKDVILEMTKIRVGACAIVEGNKLAGIIVEGDIRRYFADDKNDLNVAASGLMNPNPISITKDILAFEALNIMEKRESPISILPVIENGEFLGFIRLHDLFKEGFSS